MALTKKALQRKVDVLWHYGNGKVACVRCGYDDDIRPLTIDHINGRKNAEYEGKPVDHSTLGGDALYSWLLRRNCPAGYQTLCMNCQMIKKSENQEWGWKNIDDKIRLCNDSVLQKRVTHIRSQNKEGQWRLTSKDIKRYLEKEGVLNSITFSEMLGLSDREKLVLRQFLSRNMKLYRISKAEPHLYVKLG